MKPILFIPFSVLLSILSWTDFQNKKEEKDHKIFEYKHHHREYSDVIIQDSSQYLFPVSKDSLIRYDTDIAFLNQNKDTVIQFGLHKLYFEKFDTLYNYIIVESNTGFVGLNLKGEIIFDAYTYGDFQLDDYSDGLCRIHRNGKIGYINKVGEIVIPCIYECADYFENGKARVALKCVHLANKITGDFEKNISDEWFYINKKGERIND